MRVYVKLNKDGTPAGFWPDGINADKRPKGCKRITEAQWEALRQPGKRWDGKTVVDVAPPAVTARQVRDEAARRLGSTDWYVVRAADPTSGEPVPQAVVDARTAIRAACDALLALDPIPADYTEDARWS